VRALPLLLLALAPFAVVFGQNYGGEASLRIVLFSSPWWAALISWAFVTVTRGAARWILMVFAALVATMLFVPSFFGQEELNIVSADEVRASGLVLLPRAAWIRIVAFSPRLSFQVWRDLSRVQGP
jgi:hypothetical protein